MYREYGGLVYRRAWRMLGDRQEAEAAVQEVFVRVLRKIEAYDERDKVQNYLFRITTNYCLDQIKSQRRRPKLYEYRPELTAGGIDPEREAAGREMLKLALEQSDARVAQAGWLHHVDGMNQERISEVMELSRRTVGKLLKKFRARARQQVKDE